MLGETKKNGRFCQNPELNLQLSVLKSGGLTKWLHYTLNYQSKSSDE